MLEEMAAGFLDEDTLPGVVLELRGGLAGAPCLTILAHSAPSRIGERRVLRELYPHKLEPQVLEPKKCGPKNFDKSSVEVSRRTPAFGDRAGGVGQGLCDPFVSRAPFIIEANAIRGGLTLDPGCCTSVALEGTVLDRPTHIAAHMLEAGVLLCLAGRVVLWLHLVDEQPETDEGYLLGRSVAIERLRRQIARVAKLDGAVLIRGETGTGKELVATALHAQSGRASQPLISANMATLLPSTATSILFGHSKGAFTGAERRHKGLFKNADRGTLFLDEVADTPVEVQAMLLRVLETQKVQPVGCEGAQNVDVRVLSATDRAMDANGGDSPFRAALWHRLATHTIDVPPLRNRPDDIPRLLAHFVRAALQACGRGREFSAASACDLHPLIPARLVVTLTRYSFPGNVRELKNLADQMVAASEPGDVLQLPRAFESIECARPPYAREAEHEVQLNANEVDVERLSGLDSLNEVTVMTALERSDWSPSRAAKTLGVSTGAVQYWMVKCGHTRRAVDLTDAELVDSKERCGGSVPRMASSLQVSVRGLRLRLTKLDSHAPKTGERVRPRRPVLRDTP